MMGLAQHDLKELREIILDEIAKIENSLVSLRQTAQPVAPDNAIGRVSRMDAMVHQGTAERLIGDAVNRLAQLRAGLAKMDSPDYGLCPLCKLPIAIERLKAAPGAVFCVPCAEVLARKRR